MIARNDGTSEWLTRNLAHADGVWRITALNDDGDLDLSANGPQNAGGFWFAVTDIGCGNPVSQCSSGITLR
jgi:hypothetical protein